MASKQSKWTLAEKKNKGKKAWGTQFKLHVSFKKRYTSLPL